MKLGKRELSGREKDEASVKLLEQLREKLYFDDSSRARRAAFKLSWMQEDGLDILKEALFSQSTRRTKYASAYGLRSMHGRMKKTALEVLKQGAVHSDRDSRTVCRSALSLVSGKPRKKSLPERPARAGRFRIRDIPTRSRARREIYKKDRRGPLRAGGNF